MQNWTRSGNIGYPLILSLLPPMSIGIKIRCFWGMWGKEFRSSQQHHNNYVFEYIPTNPDIFTDIFIIILLSCNNLQLPIPPDFFPFHQLQPIWESICLPIGAMSGYFQLHNCPQQPNRDENRRNLKNNTGGNGLSDAGFGGGCTRGELSSPLSRDAVTTVYGITTAASTTRSRRP